MKPKCLHICYSPTRGKYVNHYKMSGWDCTLLKISSSSHCNTVTSRNQVIILYILLGTIDKINSYAQTAAMVKVLHVQHIVCGMFVFLLHLQYI